MMANGELANDLNGKVQNLALALYDRYSENGQTSGGFNETFHQDIENGEGVVGYQYLHGTNKDVGDFNMNGNATITPTADGYEVRIKSNYTWNDKIDPNPQYSTDRRKSMLAEIITLGRAESYDIHITWPAETAVRLDRNGKVISVEGYPAR